MKRILCLIDTLGMGGAERQMIGLALMLKQKGYYVDLVTYHDHDFHSELVDRYGLGCVSLYAKDSKLAKLRAVYKHIKKSGGYDWLIAFKDGPAIIGCLLKMLGVKINLIVSERNTSQSLSKSERIKFFLYRWADIIVPNSHSQATFIEQSFPNLIGKTVTITNFTDTQAFHPDGAERNDNEKLHITTVARIASQKNVLKYLEALKLLKDDGYGDRVHFDWYGDVQTGEEYYGENCFKKRVDLEIQDMVDFHPATTDIVKHYQSCDIFCLPSLYEGFPNVVCEAMSCGKPIVCSRVCDNPYIVQDNVNGLFFNPNEVQSIYEGLKMIIDLPREQLALWGRESRRIAEELFSQESFVQKYINVIEEL